MKSLKHDTSSILGIIRECHRPVGEVRRDTAVPLPRDGLPLHRQLYHCTSVQQTEAEVMTHWQRLNTCTYNVAQVKVKKDAIILVVRNFAEDH